MGVREGLILYKEEQCPAAAASAASAASAMSAMSAMSAAATTHIDATDVWWVPNAPIQSLQV